MQNFGHPHIPTLIKGMQCIKVYRKLTILWNQSKNNLHGDFSYYVAAKEFTENHKKIWNPEVPLFQYKLNRNFVNFKRHVITYFIYKIFPYNNTYLLE